MNPADRRRWLALAPPEPPPPKRPPPPSKWKAAWRAIADDLLSEEPPALPPAEPPRPPPAMLYRRHRADTARRFGIDPDAMQMVEAELAARRRDRTRAVDDQAEAELAGRDDGRGGGAVLTRLESALK
jgi:hypothetical protein